MTDDDYQRVGPKAAEDEIPVGAGRARGLSLRAVLPNAITAAALCSGLTGIRFAIAENWSLAIFAVILAGVVTPAQALVERAGQVPPLRLGWRYQATVSSSNPRSSMRP